jgi:TonB family protein
MKNFARSLAVHAFIVALVLLCGSAIHPVVERQRYRPSLIFPLTNLPVPTAAPSSVKQPSLSLVRLAVGTARVSAASHEAAPQPVKLDTSSPLDLPQVAQRTVTAAPVARQAGFGQQTSGNGRGVNPAGFGQQMGGSGAHIVTAGFNVSPAPAPRAVLTRASEPAIVPPVVTFEATPVYTETARAARISGTVVLRVRFTADGSLKVLGVEQGLGYGLDESAIRTAESIRFTPATRDGHAVAFDTAARITFQLSQ